MVSLIAFSYTRDAHHETYSMNIDGSGLVQLTYNQADDVNPS